MPVSSYLHLAAVSHEVCAEHGDLIHLDHEHGHGTADASLHHDESEADNGLLITADHHRESDCLGVGEADRSEPFPAGIAAAPKPYHRLCTTDTRLPAASATT